MAFDIKHKFKGSPLPCWKGYSRVPGTAQGAKGSCEKSPALVLRKGPPFFSSHKNRYCSNRNQGQLPDK